MTPIEASEVEEILQRDLGDGWRNIIDEINLENPLGSASISQVHKGRLRATGEEVAVKIKYPNVQNLMEMDLRNLLVVSSYLQKTEVSS